MRSPLVRQHDDLEHLFRQAVRRHQPGARLREPGPAPAGCLGCRSGKVLFASALIRCYPEVPRNLLYAPIAINDQVSAGALSRILGIETSCDETAAAVVERAADGRATVLSGRRPEPARGTQRLWRRCARDRRARPCRGARHADRRSACSAPICRSRISMPSRQRRAWPHRRAARRPA